RVLDLAPAAGAAPATAVDGEIAGQAAAFMPALALTGEGDLIDAAPEIKPIAASAFDAARATAETPPGLYRRGEAERAINVSAMGDGFRPFPDLGGGIAVRGLAPTPTLALAPFVFAMAFGLFLVDCLAALFLGGGLARFAGRRAAAALALTLALAPDRALSQEDLTFAVRGALETHLAYVVTGDGDTDRISEEGLAGLGQILAERTSIEPAEPIGVNVERDELVFFPLIYWPVRAGAEPPSAAALAKISAYMKNGGTIFFDLQDDGAGPDFLSNAPSPATEALRAILAKIDIPPLEPVPPDHVLSKSFYLMDTFPGRYDQGPLWVESGVGDETSDGVSSIIIGSNSYAAAWAFDVNRLPLYAVIPGTDRQRELAYRTGVNIVMYALTGNYKADQVHVPALLERLGQ
ncbi:MAG: DUF4159 domain-containing protein, partial [Alphaproteobacteria bacterium]|nr:DUF4159 domain-containing protein [Alphaproteobacteria bacterium]